jgi:uncharacterized alkaline shock family protein YloU
MSEHDQQRPRSPLESERGRTTIGGGVVSKIAGMAAGEVEGIRMGGSASRAAEGVLGNVTGSQSLSRGVSVEVGRVETAIDLTMAMEYGGNVLQLAERVRDRITERVENLTGLRVAELNVTINDVVFGGEEAGEERLRSASRSVPRKDRPPAQRTEEAGAGGREHEADDTQPIDVGAARAEATTPPGGRPRDEVRPEDTPPGEDETAELRFDDDEPGRPER